MVFDKNQLGALVRSHISGDDQKFRIIAKQMAAFLERKGDPEMAEDIRIMLSFPSHQIAEGSDALYVADVILRMAKSGGISLTPNQLMKLLISSHGWHLFIREAPLFHQPVEVWKIGVSVADVFEATKHFGTNPIPMNMVRDFDQEALPESTMNVLKTVFREYLKKGNGDFDYPGYLDTLEIFNRYQSEFKWLYSNPAPPIQKMVVPNSEIRKHFAMLSERRNQQKKETHMKVPEMA